LTKLEQRLASLKFQSDTAKRGASLSDDEELTGEEFAMATHTSDTANLYETQIRKIEQQIKRQVDIGAKELSKIETITGEISGLGLIDVLAILTALWTIDIDVLLSLLDATAFERLWAYSAPQDDAQNRNKSIFHDPSLRTDAVERRRGEPTFTASEAIERLEEQVINMLAFADRTFALSQGATDENESLPGVEDVF
jgi:hypothetical protein